MNLSGKKYTVSLFHDTRTKLKGTNKSTLSLSISLPGIQFRMGLKIYITEEEFARLQKMKGGSEEDKKLRKLVNAAIRKLEIIIEVLPNPTRELIQRQFRADNDGRIKNRILLKTFFEEKCEVLHANEQFNTEESYRLAIVSFQKFHPDVTLDEIDANFLRRYKKWMTDNGRSDATAQIYLRNLKAICNKAIRDGFLSITKYPFKDFIIGGSSKSKHVLYPVQLKQLFEYLPIDEREATAKDYFIFCYLCNGMNFKDACFIKYNDIQGEMFSFVREKTKRTTTSGEKRIQVYMHDEIKHIIERQGIKNQSHESYVLPVFNGCETPLEKRDAFSFHRRKTNKILGKIGVKLGLPVKLCLNLARHSFATRLKLDGTPTSFISDALGHTSSKTTEHYLKSIPDSVSKALSESLLKF